MFVEIALPGKFRCATSTLSVTDDRLECTHNLIQGLHSMWVYPVVMERMTILRRYESGLRCSLFCRNPNRRLKFLGANKDAVNMVGHDDEGIKLNARKTGGERIP